MESSQLYLLIFGTIHLLQASMLHYIAYQFVIKFLILSDTRYLRYLKNTRHPDMNKENVNELTNHGYLSKVEVRLVQ